MKQINPADAAQRLSDGWTPYVLDVRNETEAAIQRSINTLKKGRTVIAIAHRLSTIRNAEIIYVLEEGRIVESGNHESLLGNKDVYSKLWSVQTGERIS